MLTLKVRGLKNFKLDKKQYFPQVAPTTPIGLNDVAEQIEKQSTVSLADIKGVLDAKGIHAWVDFWGYDVDHDWGWWYKQVEYYLPFLLGKR